MKKNFLIVTFAALLLLFVSAAIYFGFQSKITSSQKDESKKYLSDQATTKKDATERANGYVNSINKFKHHYKTAKSPPLPDGSISENIDALKARAKNGDYAVAYSLAVALLKCSNLDAQYQSLEEKLKSNELTQKAVKATMALLDAQLKSCSGLTKDQLSSYPELLEFAAAHGNINAQIAYPSVFSQLANSDEHRLDNDWLQKYKSNSMNFLSAAAETGNVDAMNALAQEYWNGYLTPSDKVRAFAYMYATSQSGLVNSSQSLLELWERGMTPEQIQSGTRMGNYIISQCCR